MAVVEAAALPGQGPPLSANPGEPKPLPRRFYARPSTEVARDLLGALLVRRQARHLLMARLVEVEAYAEGDPASHSYRGPTARTEIMFGPPGHLYVYFTYGMHFCMNVVTGRDGEGSAVLFRAAEPVRGVPEMARRRGTSDPRLLLAGPARLTQAFGVTRADDGTDLVRDAAFTVARGERVPDERVRATERVGIRVATERPWRFVDASSPSLSRRLR